eukprot:6556271-Lingulodinium_polyedra.AAC.1
MEQVRRLPAEAGGGDIVDKDSEEGKGALPVGREPPEVSSPADLAVGGSLCPLGPAGVRRRAR